MKHGQMWPVMGRRRGAPRARGRQATPAVVTSTSSVIEARARRGVVRTLVSPGEEPPVSLEKPWRPPCVQICRRTSNETQPERRTIPAALTAGAILAVTLHGDRTARRAAGGGEGDDAHGRARAPAPAVLRRFRFPGLRRRSRHRHPAGLRLPGQSGVGRHPRRQARLGRRRSREQHRAASGVPERRPHQVGDVLQDLHRRFPVAIRAGRRDVRAPRVRGRSHASPACSPSAPIRFTSS